MAIRHVGFALVWLATSVTEAAASVTLVNPVPVRVYDAVNVPAPVKAAALTIASDILAAASADVQWNECSRITDRSDGCDLLTAPGELVLRIVRSPTVRIRPAVTFKLDEADRTLPLGDAFVNAGGRTGVLATVYYDRVALLARAAGVDVVALLGRAIAHEIGHLLLASTTHSRDGLMRAIWSSEELRRKRATDWTFSAAEAAAIRDRMTLP